MSRQQDILFCKIAIQTGLVNQQQAEKCLALCDRREKESGRRPMIGALFTKHKLLTSDDVQRVNDAVIKRLGPGAALTGTTLPVKKGKRKGGKQRKHEDRRGRHGRQKERKIDSNTLFMGIGTGFVFVAVLVTIIIIYTRSGLDEAGAGSPETKEGAETTASTASPGESTTSSPGSTAGAATSAAEAEKARMEAAQQEVDPEFRKEHTFHINRARQLAYVDDRRDMAIQHLEQFIKQRELDYKSGGQALLEEAQRVLAEFKGESDGEEENGELEDLDQ